MTRVRTLLTGVAALTVILAVTLGLPAVLLALDVTPVPQDLGRVDLFSPDDGTLALKAIALIAWVAWAVFTASVVLEAASKARGARAPQLPGLKMPQNLARGLIGAVVMAAVALSGATAQASPITRPPTAATAAQTPTAPPTQEATTPATPPPAAPTPDKGSRTTTYTVAHRDTLWSIAENVLGDGSRFGEIVDLNPDLLHGRAGFLRVGWQLTLPAPASKGYTPVTVRAGDTLAEISTERLGRADRYPEIAAASAGITQPGGRHLTDPDLIVTGWTLRVPTLGTPHAPTKPTAPSQPLRPTQPTAPEKSAPNPTTAPPLTPTTPATPTPQARPTAGAAPSATSTPAEPRQENAPPPAAPTSPSTRQTSPGTTTPTPRPTEAAPAPLTPTQPPATPPQPTDTNPSAPTASTNPDDQESGWITPTLWGTGGILAAGLVGLLTRRRREQQRRRLPGQAMPMPTGEAAQIETDLREAAANTPLQRVDLALRSLAQHCAATDAVLPAVNIARLCGSQLDLYLDLAQQLPAPWRPISEDTAWAIDLTDHTLPHEHSLRHVAAPYPSLVTLGIDTEGGHILVDLEHLTALTVTTHSSIDAQIPREILAALAVELATSTWADDLQVTLVGGFPQLEDCLRTGRIRYAPTAEAVLAHLERRAAADRAALSENNLDDVRQARVTGAAPDTWTPEILAIAGDTTDRHRRLIESLVTDLPRVAIAAVTTETHLGDWSLDIDNANSATLNPAGLPLTPQRIPTDKLPDLLELAALSQVDELDTHPSPDATPEPTLTDVEAINRIDTPHTATTVGSTDPTTIPVALADEPPVDEHDRHLEEDAQDLRETKINPPVARTEDRENEHDPTARTGATRLATPQENHADRASTPAAPRIDVIGLIQLTGASGPIEAGKEGSCLELAAYLHLHPGRTGQEIEDAIWPNRARGTSTRTLNSTMSRLRKWLGADPSGEEYLPRYSANRRYRLHDSVTSDIALWDALINGRPLSAPSEALTEALTLVHGAPFPAKKLRYFWAESIGQRITAEIVDAAWELARRHLMSGQPLHAEAALAIGINVAPAVERLWRLRILAAHETGNQAAETEAIARLNLLVTERDEELEPETIALLDDLQAGTADLDRLIANE